MFAGVPAADDGQHQDAELRTDDAGQNRLCPPEADPVQPINRRMSQAEGGTENECYEGSRR